MLMPYLHFRGNCEEAFEFYASVFSGKIEGISRFSAETGPQSLIGKVMHGTVSLGDGRGFLSGSDQEEPLKESTAMELLFHCSDASEGRLILSKFAEKGTLHHDFAPHPPPDDDGMGAIVTDPVGYTWMFSAPNDHDS